MFGPFRFLDDIRPISPILPSLCPLNETVKLQNHFKLSCPTSYLKTKLKTTKLYLPRQTMITMRKIATLSVYVTQSQSLFQLVARVMVSLKPTTVVFTGSKENAINNQRCWVHFS